MFALAYKGCIAWSIDHSGNRITYYTESGVAAAEELDRTQWAYVEDAAERSPAPVVATRAAPA